MHGVSFALRHIRPATLFGTRTIWRGRIKVQISDIHRTMIDMLADPSVGGGIRHVADCLTAYFRHTDADPPMLIRYAETLKNGAVFKRLGFLASAFPDQTPLVEACRSRLTQGNAKLDPKLPRTKLEKVWRLWIPTTWARSPAGKAKRPMIDRRELLALAEAISLQPQVIEQDYVLGWILAVSSPMGSPMVVHRWTSVRALGGSRSKFRR